MWWRESVGSMPQTIEECDRRMKERFAGATTVRNGVVLIKEGEIVDKAAWKERVRVVFDRKKEYQYKWALNYTRESTDKS